MANEPTQVDFLQADGSLIFDSLHKAVRHVVADNEAFPSIHEHFRTRYGP